MSKKIKISTDREKISKYKAGDPIRNVYQDTLMSRVTTNEDNLKIQKEKKQNKWTETKNKENDNQQQEKKNIQTSEK